MTDQIIIINNRNKIKFNLSSIKNDSCGSVINNDFLVYYRPKKLNTATLICNSNINIKFKMKIINIYFQTNTNFFKF
jgi:hypothetical protein